MKRWRTKAFSSEVDAGSRQENASNQNLEPRSDFIGTETALVRGLVNPLQFLAEFIDQHPDVLAVIDRDDHQMHAACGKRTLERREDRLRAFDPSALGTLTLGVSDEIRISKG